MKRFLPAIAMLLLSLYMYQCGTSFGSGKAYNKTYENADEMVLDAKSRITEITNEDLKKMIDDLAYFILIDVRETAEHDAGYISGSILIPRGVLEFRIDNESFWDNEGMYMPLKSDSLVIYCKKGNRTALAADALQKMGYENVMCLEGGFLEWKETFPEMVQENIDMDHPAGTITTSSDSGGC